MGLAGREVLQLVANKLSVSQWAQTLSQVRTGLHATLSCSRGGCSLWQPHWAQRHSTNAILCLQTNTGLHTILPETLVLYVDSENGEVRSGI